MNKVLAKVKEYYLRHEKFIAEVMNDLNVSREVALLILDFKEDPLSALNALIYVEDDNVKPKYEDSGTVMFEKLLCARERYERETNETCKVAILNEVWKDVFKKDYDWSYEKTEYLVTKKVSQFEMPLTELLKREFSDERGES